MEKLPPIKKHLKTNNANTSFFKEPLINPLTRHNVIRKELPERIRLPEDAYHYFESSTNENNGVSQGQLNRTKLFPETLELLKRFKQLHIISEDKLSINLQNNSPTSDRLTFKCEYYSAVDRDFVIKEVFTVTVSVTGPSIIEFAKVTNTFSRSKKIIQTDTLVPWQATLNSIIPEAVEAFAMEKRKPSTEEIGEWVLFKMLARYKEASYITWLTKIKAPFSLRMGLAKALKEPLKDEDKEFLIAGNPSEIYVVKLIDLYYPL